LNDTADLRNADKEAHHDPADAAITPATELCKLIMSGMAQAVARFQAHSRLTDYARLAALKCHAEVI
jgi:hypothetical protein